MSDIIILDLAQFVLQCINDLGSSFSVESVTVKTLLIGHTYLRYAPSVDFIVTKIGEHSSHSNNFVIRFRSSRIKQYMFTKSLNDIIQASIGV